MAGLFVRRQRWAERLSLPQRTEWHLQRDGTSPVEWL